MLDERRDRENQVLRARKFKHSVYLLGMDGSMELLVNLCQKSPIHGDGRQGEGGDSSQEGGGVLSKSYGFGALIV